MRKHINNVIKNACIVCLLIGGGFLMAPEHVDAASYYPMSCSYYEVSYINDDGSFSKNSCYDNFSDANQKMKELGGDYVVRSASSLSPTKIVAMNSGYAYSYPGRGNNATLNIYEDIDDRSIFTKTTYVSHYYEMNYYETSRVLKDGQRGMIRVSLNGFDGYTDLEYTDLVPSKYIEKGIAIWIGGNNSYYGESAYRIVLKRNSFSAVQNGNYRDLVYTYHMSYPSGNSLNALEYSIAFGPAPDFMENNKAYYSKDAIHYYCDPALKVGAGTDYSYYQWLPLRSKTNVYAANFETFLRDSGRAGNSVMTNQAQVFIDAQNRYGVNALLLYAMAVHESAYGTSNFAVKRNNLFGWNAFDSDPDSASSFGSVAQCVNEQMGINLRGYLDVTDGRFFGSSLGNKGAGFNVKYASDPYWGMKIASYAYKIDKTANSFNGKLSDYNQYSLAMVDTFDAKVYANPNSAAKVLFTTGYGGQYQKDFIMIKLDETGEYTQIQSTNGIDESGNIVTHRTPITTGKVNPISTYDFNKSVAYITTKDLIALNYELPDPPVQTEYEALSSLSTINLENNHLVLSGTALLKGVALTSSSDMTYTLILEDFADDQQRFEYAMNTIKNDGFSLNDGVDYAYSAFTGDIDLSAIKAGDYRVLLKMETAFSVKEVELRNSRAENRFKVDSSDDDYKTLTANEIKNYRLELKVGSSPLTYSDVHKPSVRGSMVSYDSFLLDADVKLTVDGQGLIYYLNYKKPEDVKYGLYLIQDADAYQLIPSTSNTCQLNYSALLKSEYNYDNICFAASGSLKDLSTGEYDVILTVENGEYYDILPISNRSHRELPSVVYQGRKYTFYTDDSLDRVHLKITEAE